MMTWKKVDDILNYGTRKQIMHLRCPNCDGHISYKLEGSRMTVYCSKCNECLYDTNAACANCIKYFGKEYTI